MINFNVKKIAVPYDFSANAEKAISHAAFMASFLKADLYLIHVIKKNELLDIILPALKIKSDKVIVDFVNDKLEKLCVKMRKEYGILATPVVSTGNITSEISNLANEFKIDLVMMGTQGKDSKSDLFLGSNAYRLITKCEKPIMTVRTLINKKGYSNILLPVDLSTHTRQKVNYAIGMAKAFSAKITVLALHNEFEKSQKYKLEVICKQIETECKKNKVKAESVVFKTKHRAAKTASFAKQNKIDVIISMTDQLNDGKIGMLNSYSHELVHNSKVPVISIPPAESADLDYNTVGLPF